MQAYLIQLTVAGVVQTHPRVFNSREKAQKLAQKLIRTGAASQASIITVGVAPIAQAVTA